MFYFEKPTLEGIYSFVSFVPVYINYQTIRTKASILAAVTVPSRVDSWFHNLLQILLRKAAKPIKHGQM